LGNQETGDEGTEVVKTDRGDKILLAHGGGGQLSDELIRRIIQPKFKDGLAELADSAKLNLTSGSLCFTTDSYVVKPLFFNGGDIGKLAVCGTVNDLAVAGSKPIALALSLIIEEGFEFESLEKILVSISQTARTNGVRIVTGDTKTVEAGAADKIFINTTGVGTRLDNVDLSFDKIKVGDKIIITGTIGDHGMTIISQREGIKFKSQLKNTITDKFVDNISSTGFMKLTGSVEPTDCMRPTGCYMQPEHVRSTVTCDTNIIPYEMWKKSLKKKDPLYAFSAKHIHISNI